MLEPLLKDLRSLAKEWKDFSNKPEEEVSSHGPLTESEARKHAFKRASEELEYLIKKYE